jgi:hypothetical protein
MAETVQTAEPNSLDEICGRIMAAFPQDGKESILNANDLFAAAKTSRKEFAKAIDALITETFELTQLEFDVDYDEETGKEAVLYLRPASRRANPEPVGSQS